MLKTVRLVLWCVVIVAALVLGTFWIYRGQMPGGTESAGSGLAAIAGIGGPFQLTDAASGKPVTEADLKGKPSVLFFGYTFCPDVCPTTLAEATGWMKTLGADADKLNVVFVTIDPERDTPAKMKEYLSAFDTRIKGYTGSREEIDKIVKAYRVYARKVPQGDSYVMDHTAAIYLLDGQSRFVGLINYNEETNKAVGKLKSLVAKG